MELKELFNLCRKYSALILGSGLVFGLVGILFFYFFPKVYKAEGSFYISREGDAVTSLGDFTYEGYYAQQAAANYTGTFIALLESVDVRRNALAALEIPVREETLRESSRVISAKKSGPQLVSLTVRARSPERAEALWLSVSQEALLASDVSVEVTPVSLEPVVYQGFNNLYVAVFVGLVFGLLFGTSAAVLKEYLA